MTKPIENYDKLVLACSEDRAVGGHAENDEDIRQKRPRTVEFESLGTTEEMTVDSLHEAGNSHEVDNDHEVTSPEVQVVQEPRAKRSRKSRDNVEVEVIKMALKDVADAFRESTAVHDKVFRDSIAAYEKSHQKLIPEDEVWKLLEELQIESNLFTNTYLYLVENPSKVRALLGCPKHRQKTFLMEMMFKQVSTSR